ncbi:MAG: hypothetical protein ABIA91_02035 [Patescibacteria group bacterium]
MKMKIKKIYSDAIIPSYQREGDAAMDLYSYNNLWAFFIFQSMIN